MQITEANQRTPRCSAGASACPGLVCHFLLTLVLTVFCWGMEALARVAVHVQPAGSSPDNITMQAMFHHSGARAARQQVQRVIFTHSACKSAWERASNKPLEKMWSSGVCTSLRSSRKDLWSSVLQSIQLGPEKKKKKKKQLEAGRVATARQSCAPCA